ncbi:hypothetical protein GMB70_14905 [Turicibacter sanguinis]|uniref:hypothetical protein n=1 Tax=Turicibacter sanguinis TaxID=154288 RepID=UPI0012BBC555|nr:hypothetical protein [Turicibacter sanguinis]MCU7195531.1 hypothetical protein [Turicibacter sanguinis]MDB8553808.1 hypothetical protein [Turicibacter sanguinis]MTP79928.1 hypothetical protein [Turicibacter sanguinis]
MKKLFLLKLCMLTILFIAGNSIKASASTFDSNWTLKETDEFGTVYYNEHTNQMLINPFILDSKGNAIFLEGEEGRNLLLAKQTSQDVRANTISPVPTPRASYYVYSKEYSYQQADTYKYRITPYIQPGLSVTYAETKSFSESFTGTLSADAEVKKLIRAGAGFSWTTTASTDKNVAIGLVNTTNRTAAIAFTPFYNITAGPVRYYDHNGQVTNKGNHIGKSPAKIGSFADGIYGWTYYN